MNWNDINIRQYQAICHEIDEAYPDELEKSIGILSCITGLTIDYYQNEIPFHELKKELLKLEFITKKPDNLKLHSKVKVGYRYYKFNLNFTTITAGQYIDFTELVKDNSKINDNLHLILATLCERVSLFGEVKASTVKERADYFLEHMKMPYVFSLSSFFLNSYQQLMESMGVYLEKEMKKAKAMIDGALSDIGGGTIH